MTTNVNISAMSPEERAAIELDKQRWHLAFKLSTTKQAHEIRAWLSEQADSDAKADLRAKLNAMRGKYQVNAKIRNATIPPLR